MYGFIEKWLADRLSIQYDLFTLNDGNSAALLEKSIFDRVLSALTKLWREDGDEDALRPKRINSDIMGAKVLFHKYWSNEEILDGLTDGPTKGTDAMIAFTALGRPRFITESFIDRIRVAYHDAGSGVETTVQRVRDAGDPVGNGNMHVNVEGNTVTIDSISNTLVHSVGIDFGTQAAPAENVCAESNAEEVESELAEPTPVEVHELSGEEEFLILINQSFPLNNVNNGLSGKGKTIKFIGNGPKPELEAISNLADEIDKNIIIVTNNLKVSDLGSIKKKFKFSDISSHSMFIMINPCTDYGFRLPSITENHESKVNCFGMEVMKMRFLEGLDVKNQVMLDSSLSEDERSAKLHEIENEHLTSVYSKFDAIFKDTCTNITWALKDRCFMYFTFRFMDNNGGIFNRCMYELGRRFGKKLSISELKAIDKNYQGEISEKNKNDYVNFAISSSNAIVDQLEIQFKEQKSKYQEYISKAMEHGKLMQRFMEQIEAFDKEGFALKEREKATKAYQETLDIPGVLSIDINDNVVNVYTKNIYAQDERKKTWHDIGTFHIKIGMESRSYNKDNTVKILNTKHQIKGFKNGMQAPHVFPEGYICHGSLITGMIEAYKRRDLFQLIYQLILFLQQANTDDPAGAKINKWPEVSEAVAKGELSCEEEEDNEPSEAEKGFDAMLANAIPIHS